MVEIWKPIKDYEGLYEVSNFGNVRSLRFDKVKLLKLNMDRCGYFRCNLYKNATYKTYSVHRLVALAFISNAKNKSQINHIDGNKQNNRVDNLEWCTNSENITHAYKTGLKSVDGEKNHQHILTNDDVCFIRENYKPYDHNFGGKALSEKFNVSISTIYSITNHKHWKEGDADVKS